MTEPMMGRLECVGQLFESLPDRRLFKRLARLDAAAEKRPKAREGRRIVGAVLKEHAASVVIQNDGGEIDHGHDRIERALAAGVNASRVPCANNATGRPV